MDHWFDSVAKDIAETGVSRRRALRRIAGGFGAVVVASLIPGQALADTMPKCSTGGGNCDTGFNNCGTNSNCYCFESFNGLVRCGCNEYCDSATSCTTSDDCPDGYFCAVNNGCTGCSDTSGVCIHLCTSDCTLGAAPLTAGTHRATAVFG